MVGIVECAGTVRTRALHDHRASVRGLARGEDAVPAADVDVEPRAVLDRDRVGRFAGALRGFVASVLVDPERALLYHHVASRHEAPVWNRERARALLHERRGHRDHVAREHQVAHRVHLRLMP